jgi:hypothetical protein
MREATVGVQYDSTRDRFVVRWLEGGSKRCRRFRTEDEAEAFDATLVRRLSQAGRDRAVPRRMW